MPPLPSPGEQGSRGRTITATVTGPRPAIPPSSPRRARSRSQRKRPHAGDHQALGTLGHHRNPTAHFRFASPDREATFECSLDGGAYYGCSSPENIDRLSEGRHVFEVRAVDEQVTVDPSPATWIWAVDRNK